VILICGEKDQAGSAKSYNRRWAKREGLPIYWIKNAGHNSNTDKPEEINQIIRDFYSIEVRNCTAEGEQQ
jgi:pimeloyl-ACP methyl ester carboxylesterase